ncbi:nucleotidyltransferase family protein, partial [Poseidonibacter sp.]|uniref:nucleotidyltransferase family protein n=1 Tax=Poseidonibacter sp. TaxID=2321188 RepID=UPI003C72D9B7
YVTLIHEEVLLNTGGTVLANKEFFGDSSFLLIHADNLSICNFSDFIKSYINRPFYCEITMMLFKSDNPSNCGIVKLDEHSVVEEFYEKVENPPSTLANAAVYICSPSIFNFLESLDKKEIDFSTEVLPHYLGKINTYLNDIYHRDIGTVESYALSQIEILDILVDI